MQLFEADRSVQFTRDISVYVWEWELNLVLNAVIPFNFSSTFENCSECYREYVSSVAVLKSSTMNEMI